MVRNLNESSHSIKPTHEPKPRNKHPKEGDAWKLSTQSGEKGRSRTVHCVHVIRINNVAGDITFTVTNRTSLHHLDNWIIFADEAIFGCLLILKPMLSFLDTYHDQLHFSLLTLHHIDHGTHMINVLDFGWKLFDGGGLFFKEFLSKNTMK
jgi:hypothetical protein